MSSVKELLRGDVIDGSGTANYIPKFIDTNTIGNSAIYESSGNIGINTSSPDAYLTVETDGFSGDDDIAVFNRNTYGEVLKISRSAAQAKIYANESLTLGADYNQSALSSSSYIAFETDATERMRIDSSGNVGIGTSSPAYKLDVVGAGRFSSTLIIADNTAVNFGLTSQIYHNSSNAATHFTGTGGTDTVVIKDSGNVGIGTSSPTARLDVNSGTTNTVAAFRSTDSGAYIGIADPSTTLDAGYPTLSVGAIGNDLVLSTSNAERMRITSGGDVLIGATSASDLSTQFVSTDISSKNGILIKTTVNAFVYGYIRFANSSNTNIGGIFQNTPSTLLYATSSDYRLKENVVPMQGALDRIDALQPSRFNFIGDDKTVDGFLAHQVQEVVPEAIVGEKDAVDEEGNPIYQGIDQSKLVPLLVGAIQELRAEIELLKSK